MRQRIKDKLEKRSTELLVLSAIIVVGGAVATASSSNILDAGASTEEGLVAEYRFDTGTGNTAYDTVGDNDGTINGASWTSGAEGKALSFDGENDWVKSSNNLGISGDAEFSMCAWINSDTFPSSYRSFMGMNNDGSTNNGLSFTVYNGRPAVDFWVNRWRADEALDTGKWYHVCGTKKPGTISETTTIYVNGREVSGSVEGTDSVPDITDAEAVIGRLDSSRWFDGKVDEARFYSEALNRSQIRSIYNSGAWRIGTDTSNEDPSKVLDVSFQHRNSTHVLDTSGYSNHGSIVNDPEQENAISCNVGRCYSFDGNNDYVDISDSSSLDATEGVTMMMWVRGQPSGDWVRLLEKGENSAYEIFGAESGSFQPWMRINGNDMNRGDLATLPTDEWLHLAGTYNATTGESKIFVNGELKSNDSISPQSINTNSNTLRIATEESLSGSDKWEGSIDQAKVFNRSLSQREIIEKTQSLESGGSVLDLRFNREGGDKVYDYSGESNHALLAPNESAGPATVPGVIGNALKFDGVNDRAHNIPLSDMRKDEMAESGSIALWVNPEGSGDVYNAEPKRPRLIADPANSQLRWIWFDASGLPYGGDEVRIPDVSEGEWNHIVSSWDNRTGEWAVYRNGEMVKSGDNLRTETFGWDGRQFCFGEYCDHDTSFFEGKIDQAKVYPYEISSEKVQKLYSRGKSHIGSSSGSSGSGLQDGLVLSQTFNRIETCGQSDTVSCPSGMSGEVAVDESGEANHGELLNGPMEKGTEGCKLGQCLEFDGKDDHVEIQSNNELNITDSLSVELWMKPRSYSDFRSFATKGDPYNGDILNYGFQFPGSGNVRFFDYQGGSYNYVDSAGEVPESEWTHVVVTFNSGTVDFYFDGQLDSEKSYPVNSLKTSPYPLFIGKNQHESVGPSQYFNGSIDQLSVYNRSLSDKEVWKLYTQGRDREKGMAGPVAQYGFEKPTGTKHYPAKSCNQIYDARENPSSGTYWIDPDLDGDNRQQVYCDMGLRNDGWTLIYNYNHTGGTNPDANEGEWPLSHGALSHQDNLQRFDFDQQMIKEVRLRCETSNHNRIVHYVSKDSDTIQGVLDDSTTIGWQSVSNSSYNLSDHTGYLPGAAGSDTGESEPGNALFGPGFPMYNGGNYHWSIGEPNRGGNRWECDDYPGGDSHDTLHQIWIKSEGVTNIIDLTGEGNKGAISGDPQVVSGKRGKALDFDGSDDYVDVGKVTEIDNAEEATFSAWVYPTGDDRWNRIVRNHIDDNNRGGIMMGDSDGTVAMFMQIGGSSEWVQTEINTSEWTHVAGVYDGSELKIYTDGNLENSVSSGHQFSDASGEGFVSIGRWDGSGSNDWDGKIDDVRVYPYALDQGEVKQLMNGGTVSVG